MDWNISCDSVSILFLIIKNKLLIWLQRNCQNVLWHFLMQNCIKCKILRWYLETICWIKLQCQYHSEHSLKCTTPGSHSMWAWITCRVTDVFGSVSGSDFSLSSVVFESLCSAPRTAPSFSNLLAFAYLVSVFNKDTVIEVLIKN